MAKFDLLLLFVLSCICSSRICSAFYSSMASQARREALPRYISKCNVPRYHSSATLNSLPDLIADPSFNLAAGSAILGTICGGLEDVVKEKINKPLAYVFGAGAIVFTLFGAFIAFQTATLRFTFDETSFALVKATGEKIGENVVVGGENKWAYKRSLYFDDFIFMTYDTFSKHKIMRVQFSLQLC